jgi:hypothetical protein
MYAIHAQYNWMFPARNKGMHVLVSRWRKAVDVDGDYVEK